MRKFECKKCGKIFDSQGEKKNWNDPIYGYCSVWIAKCSCEEEAREYFPPKILSKKRKIVCARGGNCECCPIKH